MNPNRNWLWIAALAGFLGLTGQIWKWHNLQVDPAGVVDRSNISIPGVVTADQFVGAGDALTGVAKPETNWWAVFTIEDPESLKAEGSPLWTDITLQCWTNGPTHGLAGGPVFAYTTADPALNGIPAWESFTTNWYPRAFWCQVHDYHDITWLAEWKSIKPTFSGSILDAVSAWDDSSEVSNPFRWVILIRDAGPWFHPTNLLSWAYTLQNDTATPALKARDGTTTLNNPVWNKVVPMWVGFDPRPKRFRAFDNASADIWVITNQHQRP